MQKPSTRLFPVQADVPCAPCSCQWWHDKWFPLHTPWETSLFHHPAVVPLHTNLQAWTKWELFSSTFKDTWQNFSAMHLCRDNPGAWWNAQALFLGNSISCLWIFHVKTTQAVPSPTLYLCTLWQALSNTCCWNGGCPLEPWTKTFRFFLEANEETNCDLQWWQAVTTNTHRHLLFDKPKQHQQLEETARLTALLCKFWWSLPASKL